MREIRRSNKIILTFVIAAMMWVSCGCAGSEIDIDSEIDQVAEYLVEQYPNLTVGSVGGEWVVKGLVSSSYDVEDDYIDRYYDSVRAQVKSKKGVISEDKYTEYERVTIALAAIGKDPSDVEGYDLVMPLDDYDKVTSQGNNAVYFALIASNSAGVKLKNEERYLDFILEDFEENQMYKDAKYMDYIAMCAQSLSFYSDREDVNYVVDKCINAMSEFQQKEGDYGNCETTSECIIAVTSLGIDPTSDERFIKDGANMVDGLIKFKSGEGFRHIIGDGVSLDNRMPSEKALLALSAVKLFEEGKTLY